MNIRLRCGAAVQQYAALVTSHHKFSPEQIKPRLYPSQLHADSAARHMFCHFVSSNSNLPNTFDFYCAGVCSRKRDCTWRRGMWLAVACTSPSRITLSSLNVPKVAHITTSWSGSHSFRWEYDFGVPQDHRQRKDFVGAYRSPPCGPRSMQSRKGGFAANAQPQ
ncbi:hypothetical protein M404DRAFT_1002902 [Pisolithus tinctorius Marx 270]|uniref:Uncharacterized protein n=1 Tax=Pisolithus tinctorius Marx 270 TaxID=870435 RepID=A0A0C3IY95_PISTI|nr:hypothetical protein M404DRAFT_1002902 [Pisolithus tinctorius Marx 270]